MIIAKFFQNLFALLAVVAKRLWHNLGITVSALIGIVSVLSLVVCVPIFSHAISSSVLRQQLNDKVTTTHRRMFSLHMYFVDTGSTSVLNLAKVDTVSQFINTRVNQLMDLPVEKTVLDLESGALDLMPIVNKGYNDLSTPLANLHFLVLDTLPQYADIIQGQWPAPDTSNSGPIQIAVSKQLADQILLDVGEKYTLGNLEVEITGIWRARNPNDPIWFSNPEDAYLDMAWVPMETFRARISPVVEKPIYYSSWYVIINDGSLNFQKITPICHRANASNH